MTTTKKITLATLKSFVIKNEGKLFIKLESRFNGMADMVDSVKDSFKIATPEDKNETNTLGIKGAWIVGFSRDYFRPFENEDMEGIYVYNSCGSFTIAKLKGH